MLASFEILESAICVLRKELSGRNELILTVPHTEHSLLHM